jgi:hypothetical protein
MPLWKLALCRAILVLDRIPRYGRYYTFENGEFSKAHWSLHRNGLWGFYLLDRLGWLWPLIDYYNPEPDSGEDFHG